MDEEKKFSEGENTQSDTYEKNYNALNEELENLRSKFSQVYKETSEGEGGPAIQELAPKADAEENAKDAEEAEENDVEIAVPAAEEKKAKKKKSKAKTVIVTVFMTIICLILLVIAVALVGSKLLCGSFNPQEAQTGFIESIGAFDDAVAAADAAAAKIGTADDDGTLYETAVENYQSALDLCTDDTWFCNRKRVKTAENYVSLLYKNSGFGEAYSALISVMSDDEIAKSKNADVVTLRSAADKVSAAALRLPADVIAAVKADEKFSDTSEITAGYGLDEAVLTDFTAAADALAAAYKSDIANASPDAKNEALSGYEAVLNDLNAIGADAQLFTENLCAALYDNGCVYSAISFSSVLGEEYEAKTDAYKEMMTKKEALADSYSEIFALAQTAAADGKTGAELLEKDDVDAAVKEVIASVIDLCAEGIKAKEEKNLTVAFDKYAAALSSCQMFGISDAGLIFEAMSTVFTAGSVPEAQSVAESFVTDDVKAKFTDEQTAGYEKMEQVFAALDSASEVFSSYYTNYYYYGTEIDVEALNEELDATITDESNDYDKAFVAYCKYYAASLSGDNDGMAEYIGQMKELAPDIPFVYSYFELSFLTSNEKFAEADALADKLLEINAADDYAISTKALARRMNKDYAAAAEIAANGIELVGDSASNCMKEAGVAYMLAGDYEKAFDMLYDCYQANLTLENCDLLLILNYLAKDSTVAEELASAAEEVNATYENYQVTSFDDTLAILDGSKTAEEVLTSGTGTLSSAE